MYHMNYCHLIYHYVIVLDLYFLSVHHVRHVRHVQVRHVRVRHVQVRRVRHGFHAGIFCLLAELYFSNTTQSGSTLIETLSESLLELSSPIVVFVSSSDI